jgi:CDP-diacylglycerol--serine O-phosphatidyltransferase
MPCPAAAAAAAAWVWTLDSYGLRGGWVIGLSVALTIFLALVMVSNLPYKSFKDFNLKDRVPFVALLALVFLFVLISFDPPRVLFIIFFVYLFSGPVLWLRRRQSASDIGEEVDEDTGEDAGEDADNQGER